MNKKEKLIEEFTDHELVSELIECLPIEWSEAMDAYPGTLNELLIELDRRFCDRENMREWLEEYPEEFSIRTASHICYGR